MAEQTYTIVPNFESDKVRADATQPIWDEGGRR